MLSESMLTPIGAVFYKKPAASARRSASDRPSAFGNQCVYDPAFGDGALSYARARSLDPTTLCFMIALLQPFSDRTVRAPPLLHLDTANAAQQPCTSPTLPRVIQQAGRLCPANVNSLRTLATGLLTSAIEATPLHRK